MNQPNHEPEPRADDDDADGDERTGVDDEKSPLTTDAAAQRDDSVINPETT